MRDTKHRGCAWPLMAVVGTLLAGCSGATTSRPSGDAGTGPEDDVLQAGMGGKPSQPHGSAGSATAGSSAGGAVPSDAQLEEEIACLDGASYVVKPPPGGSDCGGLPQDTAPFVDHLSLHFEQGAPGELWLVTSTFGPWLEVRRSRVVRTARGWNVVEPPASGGCFAYHFEEEVAPYWSKPARLDLELSQDDCQPSSLTAHFGFDATETFGAETITVEAVPDTEPPRLIEVPYVFDGVDRTYYPAPGGVWSWVTPRSFSFSEELRPGWLVSVVDPRGKVWPVAEQSTGRFGIDVDGYFPEGSRWLISGEDLAGNAFAKEVAYPVRELPLSDGQFETEGGVARFCDETSPGDVSIETSTGTASQVPALTGNTSLRIESCTAVLRLPRAADAQELRFSARLLGFSDELAPLTVSLKPLRIGEVVTGTRTVLEDFELDSALSGPYESVSQPRELALPLPPGTGDVLVSFEASEGAWIDSVRIE